MNKQITPDPTLTVYTELPEGFEDWGETIFVVREAWRPEPYAHMHFCKHCGGWIEGHAKSQEVDTLNTRILVGREGTVYFCRRCGQEIAFMGIMG